MPDPDAPFIGIDLGGTNISAGVLSRQDALLASDRIKTKAEQGPDGVLQRIARLVGNVIEQAGLTTADLGGVGIGAPGPVDDRRGVVLNAVNLRWHAFPLADELGKLLDLPVVVDNDVNVGTWGEFKLGAGRGHEHLMGLFVGTGIGAGLVLHGQLYRGAFHTAGEIGHTAIAPDASLGRRTLENLASRNSIVNQLTQLVLANHPTDVPELKAGKFNKVRSKVLANSVAAGDELVLEVIHDAARYVGIAVANAVSLLSLPAVVLGGGLSEALGEAWAEPVRAAFARHVFPAELRACKIVTTALGDGAGMTGAAMLARQRLGAETKRS